jgi:hypothetical protein
MPERATSRCRNTEVLILCGIGHQTTDPIFREYATVKSQEVYGVLDGNANDLSDL